MLQSSNAAPVLVEVWRGAMVESRHRGIYAVVDVDGRVVESGGDVERAVYARSAIKPLQAIALVETGAAAAFSVSDEEIALACASHAGEPRHIEVVSAWQARVGLSVDDLECGGHPPTYPPAAHALIRSGAPITALHNNCSGKHTGMLTTCRHCREPTRGYIAIEHPAQQRIARVLSEMTGRDLFAAPRGIDGCGLPQLGIPVWALALAFARFGAPDTLAPAQAAACRRIAGAMVAHPFMVAGTGRFCTTVLELAHGKVVLKTGAEGVYVAAIPAKGLGIALKIEDGAGRASEVALAALIDRHAGLDEQQRASLAALLHPSVRNVAGREVGEVAPADSWKAS
jgi:L-asparaginase II